MHHHAIEENLFFYDTGSKFPYLRKRDRIPTESLPEALQEFRLTSGITSTETLKVKEKNKQNVNFIDRGAVDAKKNRKKRKKTRTADDIFSDYDVEDDGKFLYEESKYSATTILSQLGKILQNVWERTLFQYHWQANSEKALKFEKNIKGFKWRFEITDKQNQKPFFLPDYLIKLIDVEYENFIRAVQYKPREWQTTAYKDVIDFSSGALKRTDSGIFSVPLTRMSEITCTTLLEGETNGSKTKTKDLVGKSSKDSGMTMEVDGPAIMAYRRESKTPQYYIPKPKHDWQYGRISIEKGPPRPWHLDDVTQTLGIIRNLKVGEDDDDAIQKLQFSLGSKDCHDRGWIANPSSFGEHERKAVRAYLKKRLGEVILQREQEEIANEKTFINPEVVVHHYGDAKKKAVSKYQRKRPSSKGNKKKGVPFMVTLRDGSYTIYYPSGNVAVVNSFVPGHPSSSYILVYGDACDNNTIFAHFTPSGRGVCYHKNGQISFISTSRYACCHDEAGALINKWKWTGRKLVPSYTLQLSSNLTFRCSNKDSMALFVNIDGESTKIKLVENDVTEETLLQQQEHIIPAKKPKRRKGRHKDEAKIDEKLSKLSITSKSSSEVHSYTAELNVLHNKFKETVHDWMDHYRIAVGIKPPMEMKGKRRSTSKSAGTRHNISTKVERISSAPANFRYSLQERGKSPPMDGLIISDDSAICLTKIPFRCGVLQSPGAGLPKKGCPVVCRMKMMGISDTHCRCDRKKIPIVTDIEFDTFITSLPKTQLVVVSVFKERSSNPFDSTLNEIHYHLNKDRSFPCVQSSCDPYRLLRYPVPCNSATAQSSLLIDRHKVAAGMFIMYLNGKLLFSDYIFDGYGYTKKDFLNQISRTRKEALEDKYLPDDFHFSPRSRSPIPHPLHEHESSSIMDVYNSSKTSVDAHNNRVASTSNDGFPETGIRFVDDVSSKADIKPSNSSHYVVTR